MVCQTCDFNEDYVGPLLGKALNIHEYSTAIDKELQSKIWEKLVCYTIYDIKQEYVTLWQSKALNVHGYCTVIDSELVCKI